MEDNLAHWRKWIGRSDDAADTIDVGRARALQATLDDPSASLLEGDALPPLWQWIYFWQATPTRELAGDGHAARGRFMPPIDLPRRMWAGCRISMARPLTIGRPATRRSTIADVQLKSGRSGALVFVTVRNVFGDADGDCIDEEIDIAYRPAGNGSPPAGVATPREADWRLAVTPSTVMLFRYSALIFNAHRIHYDRDYARRDEGYPDILVHGPLMATLIAEAARRNLPGAGLSSISCRAVRPCFADRPVRIGGRAEGAGGELWLSDHDGYVAMRANAAWRTVSSEAGMH